MPLSFQEVRDIHERAKLAHPDFASMDLQTFSKFANETTGSEEFNAGDVGAVGGLVKRASSGLDSLLEPVSNLGAKVGRAVGDVVGFGDIVEDVGRAVPRTALDTLAVVGGMAAGPVGWPVAAAGLASTGAKGYTDTGSPVVGALQAGATALMPGAAKVGGQVATKLSSKVAGKVPEKLAGATERLIEYGGMQVGAQVPFEGAAQLGSVAQGEGLRNPFTKENIVGNIAGGLAFAPFDAPMLVKGYKHTSKGPEAANLVDLARGTETPIRSLADAGRVEKGRKEVAETAEEAEQLVKEIDQIVSLDAVVDQQQVLDSGVKTEKKTGSDLDRVIEELAEVKEVRKNVERVQAPVPQAPETPLEQLANRPVSLEPLQDLADKAYVHFKAGAKPSPKTISDKLNIPFSQATQVMSDLVKRGLVLNLQGDKWDLVKLPGRQKMTLLPPDQAKGENVMDYLSNVVKKLEDLGVGEEQLVRLAKLGQTAGKPRFDVDTAVETARREILAVTAQAIDPTLGKVFSLPDDLATVRGVTSFFRSLYEQRGYTPKAIDRIANVATKMAVATGQFNTRVVTGEKGETSFFIPLTETPDGKMVVLSQDRTFEHPERDVAHSLWVAGHELIHAWGQDVKLGQGDEKANKVYNDAYSVFREYTPEELANVFQGLHRSVFPTIVLETKGLQGAGGLAGENRPIGAQDIDVLKEAYETRNKIYAHGEQGVREFMADVAGLLAMGASSPAGQKNFRSLREMVYLAEPRVQDFMFQMFTDVGAALNANEVLLHELWKGEPGEVKKVAEPMTVALRALGVVMRERLRTDQAKQYLSMVAANLERTPFSPTIGWNQIEKVFAATDLLMWKGYGAPEAQEFPEFRKLVKQGYEMMFEPSTWEKVSGLKLGFLDYLKPMGQLVKDFPMLGPVFDLGTSFQNIATETAKKLWAPFFKVDGSGKLDEEFIKQLTDPRSKIQEPLSKLTLLQNEVQRFANDAEFKEYAGHLSEEQQAVVRRGLSSMSQASVMAATLRINAERSKMVSSMAAMVVRRLEPELKVDATGAYQLGEQAFEHLMHNAPVTPGVQALPIRSLAELAEFVKVMKDPWEKLRVQLMGEDGKGKPWWTSEVRLGDFFLGWRENKRGFVKGFQTKKEALEYREGLLKKGINPKAWDKSDRAYQVKDVDADMIQRYAEMDKIQYEKMLSTLDQLSPEEKDWIREMYQPGEGAWRMLTPPSMQERNLLGGREDLNMMAGMMHYIDSTALGLAKMHIKAQAGVRLHAPELRNNPNIQNAARSYLNNIINPQGKEFRALKSMVFFQYMGLNPATWFVEPTQLAVAHVPYLVREGAGTKQAYQLTAKAMTKAARYAFDPKAFDKEEPLLAKLLKRAADEGVVDQGFIQDVTMTEDVNTINLRNVSRGNDLINGLELAKKPGYWLMKLARDFYSVPAHLVTRSAFLSSLEYGLSKGFSEDRAYSFAKDAVRSTTYTGGTAARPLVFSYMGKGVGVGGLVYTLSSYTFNTIAYMARLAKESIGKATMTDAEKSQARKATALMLGTQVALGGALGLPFAASAIALIEQVFPEAEVRKGLREGIAGLFDEDEQMGGMMTDAALHGVLNVGPVDVGSRFQLGNVFGINSYDGFSWQNVFGPAANVASNWTKAVGDVSKGDTVSAAKRVAPSGLRGLVDLATNNWEQKDRLGNLIYAPTEVETVARILGFSPKRLSQYYEQQSILQRSEKIAGDKLNQFHRDLAQQLVEGDFGGVRKQLIEMQTELKGYDARVGARRVAELVQNMTEPADLYRQGRKIGIGERSQLAQTYNQPQGKPEVVRLQERLATERKLQIPGVGVPSKMELTLAQMVDQVRAMNPSLTYQQAKEMVVGQMRPQRPAY